jgi:DMSO/TMAO reductase YedYZ heme-binding membrane subunit
VLPYLTTMATTGHRFSPVTQNDHAGSIWIATLLCVVYSAITIATRGFLRKQMYGIDDYLILGAFVCARPHCIT